MQARCTWLLAPALLAAMIALNPLNRPTYLMGDFRAFYCAGNAIALGANPYREEPLRTCEAHAGPPSEPAFLRPVALPAPLPPYALMLFAPLSRLPFALAAALYGVLMLAAMTWSVRLFARAIGTSSVALDLAFAAITAMISYYIGQPTPLVFLALAGAALFVRSGRWWAASACAVAATIEPHIALPVLVAMAVALPRTRMPIALCGAALVGAGVLATGLPLSVEYVREVVPAHALANAYEWQFSLTSVLTSAGVAAPLAIRCGEIMFAMMVALGVAVAMRLARLTGDAALLVLVPPAFGVFGGVHVHFQQLAIAFPALLYAIARWNEVRRFAATGLALAMIPWNVMGASLLAGVAPVLVGAFAALTMDRRRGLYLAAIATGICLSLLILANLGLGPAENHFVARSYPPNALAESSWGDFSRAALMRPSFMMQWLRIPTVVGLACGLCALVRVAFAFPSSARSVSTQRPVVVPVVAR